ncbi:MAG: VWA domain-containing protein [Rhodothalassiaceae bacterium]
MNKDLPRAPRGGGTSPADPREAIDAFLADLETRPVRRGDHRRGRLVFALDATMSRQPAWDRACAIQGEMFEAAAAIGGLSVQLVYFRGLRECKASRWQDDAAGLARLMSRVACRGGYTQIGRVLTHVLKEAGRAPVDAAIFVGDACEEAADRLCALAGELGVHGIPLFLFHEGSDLVAARAFAEMARLSGGACVPFDSRSADQLRDLLRAVATYAAGGAPALLAHAEGSAAGRRLIEQMRR